MRISNDTLELNDQIKSTTMATNTTGIMCKLKPCLNQVLFVYIYHVLLFYTYTFIQQHIQHTVHIVLYPVYDFNSNLQHINVPVFWDRCCCSFIFAGKRTNLLFRHLQSENKALDCAQQEELTLNVSSTLIYKSVVPCLYMSHSIALCSPHRYSADIVLKQLNTSGSELDYASIFLQIIQQDRIDPLLTLRSILGLSDCLFRYMPFTRKWSHT